MGERTGSDSRPRPSVRRRALSAIAVASALLLLAAACGSDGSGKSSAKRAPIPAPEGLPAFYAVPQPLPSGPPGRLLKSEKVSVPDLHGTVYRVMYLSRSQRGRIVPVTGLVAVPSEPAPPGGYRVLTWGHGTNGMADQCAPSLDPESAAPLANTLLDEGWVVTASDYEGEGTPGLLPYIAGTSAAQNVIDIVRAADHLPALRLSRDYVVWGHSEGGQTAMFALHIADRYAPELHLRGVVAGAPPSQFNLVYSFLKTSPFRYYLLMAAGGLNAAYGDKAAPLDEVLTPSGMALLPELEKGCSDYLARKLGDISIDDTAKTDPFTVPAWQKILRANDPQQFARSSPQPLLIIQGGNDEQIPVASTKILADHLCSIGQHLERWIYPGQSHAGVIGPSSGDMLRWIRARFAGTAGSAGSERFTPSGSPGIEVTVCPR